MRLAFVPDGSPDCPLLCLRDFRPEDVAALRRAARELAYGATQGVRLEERLALGEMHLHLAAGQRDQGLREVPDGFEIVLTPVSWSNVEGLLEPFEMEAAHGYQWLDRSGDIALLISCDGGW